MMKSQKEDSILVKKLPLSGVRSRENTFKERGRQTMSILSSIIIGSPSRCMMPSRSRSIVNDGVLNEMIFVSWSMCFEKSSSPRMAVSKGVIGSTTVTRKFDSSR